MLLSKDELMEIFIETGALLEGHFLLTSGRHSNQYFQCAKVLQFMDHTTQICSVIADKFKDYQIDTVVSPAIGGIVVGQEVARQLNKKSIFAEREDGKLTLRRGFTISPGEKVLVCEDVVTTGGSVFEVIDIVKEHGGIVVGVGMIVDRSDGNVDFKVPSLSTLKLNVTSYTKEHCPLCEKEIPIIKPGSRKIVK